MDLTILIPVKNEEKNVESILIQIKNNIQANYEVLFVNDFSTDKTVDKLNYLKKNNKNIFIINNKKKGLGESIRNGIKYSRGKYLSILMCDGSDDLNDLQKYYELIHSKNLDAVFGSRFMKNSKINEEFSTDSPITFYGFTKLSSELLIKEYSFLYNLKYIINRCGVISGFGQFGRQDQGFLSMWLWRHLNNIKISYQGFGGYGNQVRDVLDIEDLCSLIKEQIKKINVINNDLFNVGGGYKNAISLKELTNLSVSATKKKIIIKKK